MSQSRSLHLQYVILEYIRTLRNEQSCNSMLSLCSLATVMENDYEVLHVIVLLIAIGDLTGGGSSLLWYNHDDFVRRIRTGSKSRLFDDAPNSFSCNYFNVICVYDEEVFETHFRMPRVFLNRLCDTILRKSVLKRRKHAKQKEGLCPIAEVSLHSGSFLVGRYTMR